MKVKDLIELLQKADPEALVVRYDYEYGSTQVTDVEVVKLYANKGMFDFTPSPNEYNSEPVECLELS